MLSPQNKPDVGGAGVDGARAGVGRALPAAGRGGQQQGPLAGRARRRCALQGPREENRYNRQHYNNCVRIP